MTILFNEKRASYKPARVVSTVGGRVFSGVGGNVLPRTIGEVPVTAIINRTIVFMFFPFYERAPSWIWTNVTFYGARLQIACNQPLCDGGKDEVDGGWTRDLSRDRAAL